MKMESRVNGMQQEEKTKRSMKQTRGLLRRFVPGPSAERIRHPDERPLRSFTAVLPPGLSAKATHQSVCRQQRHSVLLL